MSEERKHGSPYDRGSMDAYYGRRPRPHIWLDSMGRERVPEDKMTKDQIKDYYKGYDEEDDRKDWG